MYTLQKFFDPSWYLCTFYPCFTSWIMYVLYTMVLYWLIYIFLYLMVATVSWVFQFLSFVPGLDYTFRTELLSSFSIQTHNVLVRNLPYWEIMGKLIFAEAVIRKYSHWWFMWYIHDLFITPVIGNLHMAVHTSSQMLAFVSARMFYISFSQILKIYWNIQIFFLHVCCFFFSYYNERK